MTKVLLINNDSDTWQELIDSARDAGFEVTMLHCRDITLESADGYDAVILSGGWWYDDEIQHLESYKAELEFLRATNVPTVGICIGMQLMQLAYSGQVQLLGAPQHGLQPISLTPEGRTLLGWPETVTVHKNHTMGALVAASDFEVLGYSPGHVEIVRHTSRPLLGVQFHPEIGSKVLRVKMLREIVDCAIGLMHATPASPANSISDTDVGTDALLIPNKPALDQQWFERIGEICVYTPEIYMYLEPTLSDLTKAYAAFTTSGDRDDPDLRPDPAHAPMIAAEKSQLKALLQDVMSTETDRFVREAYVGRLQELINNAELYEAAMSNDAVRYKLINQKLYGEPDSRIFASVVQVFRQWIKQWATQPHVLPYCREAVGWLPSVQAEPFDFQPIPNMFTRQRELHMGVGGFYANLFGGTIPEGVITESDGDPLIRRLLHSLKADTFRLEDADGSYWGVHYGNGTVIRPARYIMSAEEFIGVVGHEVGSHLLEWLNGRNQPLRLLSLGLDGLEKGNEGRALVREQVVYSDWQSFADTWRWYEILRRHFAISLGCGVDGSDPRPFNEVFRALLAMDTLWEMAHGAEDNQVTQSRIRLRAWELAVRVLKGTNGSGGAYYKDIVYLEGNIACWRLAEADETIIADGDLGKYNITNPAHRALIARVSKL